ncbi:hypothetical protein GC425_07540 [Corynebacterium sp. zg254]|uniref:Uncharacterized protein n=1 Tax=Corynebacterium zhongnanshanii TaxID=2768834 RepID=A0ABQ6VHS1_9CORY|nr:MULTISPECIES: hypothetical protein [Corynebacterium]KAB3519781.1 hypothetical protein F8377_07580 [Corynebacterium zhongnanshanii]MCR5914707.1 hypothetical protein [Corynebacterium sp. zg254]
MAKKPQGKIFKRDLPVPLAEAHRVVSSRTYLCTDEDMARPEQNSTGAEIFHADYTVDDEGVTHAVVHMRSVDGPEGSEAPETGQAVAVQPLEEDGFSMHTLVSLPHRIGNLRTVLTFEPSATPDVVRVTAYVEADIPVKAVGKALTKKLLASSPDSVDRGLERIVRLSAREDL